MSRISHKIIVSFVLAIYLAASLGSSNNNSGDEREPQIRCKEAERLSLLKFKGHLREVMEGALSSWGNGEEENRECCEWIGIRCNNTTGHVIGLDLSERNYVIEGNISSSLVNLEYLNHLDLSYANMSRAHDWVQVINNLPSLTTLVLSDCNLPESVSPHLSLSNPSKALSFLDLSYNFNVDASIFHWLYNYSRTLVHLDLSDCSISTTIPDFLGSMYSVKYLDLSGNQFKGSIPAFFRNMTALSYLSLAGNQLDGYIPEMFGNMSSLEYLSLSSNMLNGGIPKTVWQICMLEIFKAYGNHLSGELHLSESSSQCPHFPLKYLDLSENWLSGSVPNFTLYPYMVKLSLCSNQLHGNISKSIGQLSKLEFLDISSNNFSTVMSEEHFSKLLELYHLDLSSNSHIVFNVSSDWKPPFQLSIIYLQSCNLGPHFPLWLQSQTEFSELDISYSGISDPIPTWLWNISTISGGDINLSDNEIGGTIQYENKLYQRSIDIDLSSNQLEGPIPEFLFHIARSLDLSNNRFTELNSICNGSLSNSLKFIDVSSNRLTGELPDCWSNVETLEVLRLENNKLTGKIPVSIGFLFEIWSLHLSNNSFTGEFPLSMKMMKRLKVLTVAENNLSSNVPTWISEELPNMVVLSLRSNYFYGKIPSELCDLQHLQVLDLSSNSLSGSIPTCLCNINAMKRIGERDPNIAPRPPPPPNRIDHTRNIYGRGAAAASASAGYPYNDKLRLVWKGTENELTNLGLLTNIDLSSNKLVGEIPSAITELIGLNSLNLSRNNLTGKIPHNIGQLESLDAIDLSTNHLFGKIPPSLSRIDRLGVLNLSSNNLSGEIPLGTQLQRQDATSYADNPELCGAPLRKKCPVKEEPTPRGTTKDKKSDDEDDLVTKGFHLCAVIGFIVGFWGFCGTLIFNKSWRYRYLNFLESKGDWLYVTVTVHKAKLLRIIKS